MDDIRHYTILCLDSSISTWPNKPEQKPYAVFSLTHVRTAASMAFERAG